MVESKSYDLDLIFHALADPTRRAMLKAVSKRPRSVSELARPFEMSLAAVSKHLQVLERARLVEKEKRGSFYFVTLNAGALMTAEQWIAWYRQFWDARLDALKDLLEKENR